MWIVPFLNVSGFGFCRIVRGSWFHACVRCLVDEGVDLVLVGMYRCLFRA